MMMRNLLADTSDSEETYSASVVFQRIESGRKIRRSPNFERDDFKP
jgi:hypothetical protein